MSSRLKKIGRSFELATEDLGALQQLAFPEFDTSHDSDPVSPIQISVFTGDMFLSEMQTLTITVNTFGVMGKGLALHARKRFPDVYAEYSHLCKQKMIEVGKPSLYRSSFNPLIENGEPKGFLLFPTKKHWRSKSRIEFIVDGLEYLIAHYRQWEIESLAMPALGCGLGGLPWKEVGPVMYRALVQLDIPVEVYLPHGKPAVPPEQLTQEFLLGE